MKTSLSLETTTLHIDLTLPAQPEKGLGKRMERFRVQVDKEVADLIPLMSKRSQNSLFRLMAAGRCVPGNPFTASEELSEGIENSSVKVRQIRADVHEDVFSAPERPLQINPSPTYVKRLEQEGYKLVKQQYTGNGFYEAVSLGIRRMLPQHPECPADVNAFKEALWNKVKTSEQHRARIHTFLVWELWETVTRQHESSIMNLLNLVSKEMRQPLLQFYQAFKSTDQPDKVFESMNDWAYNQGIDQYIDGIKEGIAFNGVLEAGMIFELYGLPITIHQIRQSMQGVPLLIGDDKAPPAERVHIYHYSNRFDLMQFPEHKAQNEPIVIE